MIFEVDSIKWGYDDIPQDQILAQFNHLYNIDYKASERAHNLMKSYISESTPEDTDQWLIEECRRVIDNAISQKTMLEKNQQVTEVGYNYAEWPEISTEIKQIARTYGVTLRRVQGVMRINGAQKRTRDRRLYV